MTTLKKDKKRKRPTYRETRARSKGSQFPDRDFIPQTTFFPTRPNPTHTNRWRCSSQWDRKGVHFINVLYVFCLIVKQLGNFDHLVQENVLHGAVIFRFLFVDEIIIKN